MSESRLELSIALSENENTCAILDGRIQPDAIKLHATPLHPSVILAAHVLVLQL